MRHVCNTPTVALAIINPNLKPSGGSTLHHFPEAVHLADPGTRWQGVCLGGDDPLGCFALNSPARTVFHT